MILYCQNITQKKIISCLLKYNSLTIYELMKLTKIPKTTIIDNINKHYKLISSFKESFGKKGRPNTYFYISKRIRNYSNVIIIDTSLLLEAKKIYKPKIKYNFKKNKRVNPTNHLHSIRKPKAYILPKRIYIIEKPIHLRFINE